MNTISMLVNGERAQARSGAQLLQTVNSRQNGCCYRH